jgi:hypothetical protein
VPRVPVRGVRCPYLLLGILLPLALLHGLLYLVIVPPWQHYDEPTHFEYARLIAIWGHPPATNETDLTTNREIADSMYRFRFWPPNFRPNLASSTPPNIGLNEKVHPPLYYNIVAVPVRWGLTFGIESQLYAARMVAVVFYTLVIACAWRIATIAAPDRPLLHGIVPLILILVPAFADQMSAVNNDSLVNFSTTVLLLGCVLLIRDGLRPLALILAMLGLVVALLTKRTALVGLVPFVLALFWSLWRRPLRWWVWLAALFGCVLLAATLAIGYDAGNLSIRPWLLDFDRQYLRLALDRIVVLPNWGDISRTYPGLFDILFRSFWMGFGWGAVEPGRGWDWALRVVVVAALIGLLLAALRARRAVALWQRRVLWLFFATTVAAWLAIIARFATEQSSYIPRGRYMHLALVPTVWLLVLGVERLVPSRWRAHALIALALFFAVLDTVSWAEILIGFYYR